MVFFYWKQLYAFVSENLLMKAGRFVFFAFTKKFNALNDPKEVITDFKESRIADMSTIGALNVVTKGYHEQGKKVHLRHLSQDCILLLKNAEAIIDVNIIEDPTYKLVEDKI